MGGESMRRFGELADFEPVVRATFGTGRRLAGMRRLRGGSKKGVYQLVFDDGAAVIAYVWGESENYWAAAPSSDSQSGPFSDATGAGLFAAAHSLLRSLGVRVPELYVLDQSRAVYPADVALVECVAGESLESLLDSGAPGAHEVVRRLRESLDVMHGHRDPCFGKIGAPAAGESCEQVVLDLALVHLAEAAAIGPRRERHHYELLRADQLDEQRMRLYRLAEHLSLIAGPLRLADTDFPEREFMVEIAMAHADRALSYLEPL